ncbi:MAG: hypothetical protein M1820_007279 [Bogoriella megaspora]|nr:MAG: hypothetical protein M1820_007279 [Bogoriella megaspora]
MDRSHLMPGPGGMMKLKQAEEAKEMQLAVEERAKRIGVEVPPYEFLELIGKGSFGRVFKSKDRRNQQLVAVKIIDVDTSDYRLETKNKDEAIKDFINETSILRQLKDSGAKNINGLLDAFSLHSQLWITAEYCPGGSVHTLMRANPNPGLEEHFIIPIARELAIALKYVHEAGIIHRDVKCANILITEDGEVQLCDFGVSGVLDNDLSKRTTIIGTPFWMAPEMHKDEPSRLAYGTEVDCWAFGCTVYEMATGMPPNAKIHPQALGKVLNNAPRLQNGDYTDDLRSFVSFCLQEEPQNRPAAATILDHHYISGTSEDYPTGGLIELLERYAQWEHQGGQRTSILNPFGAPGPEALNANGEVDEWNFSTTADFDKRISKRLSRLQPSLSNTSSRSSATLDDFEAEGKPRVGRRRNLAAYERSMAQQRLIRGEAGLRRIFDPNADPYHYGSDSDSSPPPSDLVFRNLSNDPPQVRTTMIDLDMADIGTGAANVDLADVPTLRANRGKTKDSDSDEYSVEQSQGTRRATRDWKFPLMSAPANDVRNRRTQDWKFPTMPAAVPKLAESTAEDSDDGFGSSLPSRPPLKHAATQPMNFDDFLYERSGSDSPQRNSMIDLDFADPKFEPRPSTASSFHSVSTSGNPFEYEEGLAHGPLLNQSFSSVSINTNDSASLLSATGENRGSLHFKSQSEPHHAVSGLLTPEQRGSGAHTHGLSYDSRSRSTTLSSADGDAYHADAEEGDGEGDLTIRGRQQARQPFSRFRRRPDFPFADPSTITPEEQEELDKMEENKPEWLKGNKPPHLRAREEEFQARFKAIQGDGPADVEERKEIEKEYFEFIRNEDYPAFREMWMGWTEGYHEKHWGRVMKPVNEHTGRMRELAKRMQERFADWPDDEQEEMIDLDA